MGYIPTGDQYRAVLRKLGDIGRQFGQAEYPFDLEHALRVLDALQKFGEGKFLEIMGMLDVKYPFS